MSHLTVGQADQTAAGDIKAQVSAEEWRQRVDLAAAYRLVAKFGWDDLVFTHLTARTPGPEHHFLINPYGLLFSEITASNLVKIDLEGNIVLNTGYPVNAAGFVIHSAVHEAREDALCVMHLHTVAGTAVASMAEGLMPLNQTALAIREQVAYHDYEGIALEPDEKPRLVRDLGQKSVMLLRNHGALTLGKTVAEAFTEMYFLERACQMQIATLAGGRELHYPPEAVMEKTAKQGQMGLEFAAKLLVWPALLRQLDRDCPDYKN